MTKRALIVLLVGINLILAATLILMAGRPAAALAQGAPLASNYLMVSGVVQQSHDALYVIDLSNRELHCFGVDRTTKKIMHRGSRDLLRDFRADQR
ncbi:MAG: hypothetical protein L6Q92_02810 [Phycisphaerae bacterium]|nr:hypothetical protein [Phycisphaerae bacterium]